MWDKEISVARSAAQNAGRILKKMFGNINHIEKKGEVDLVTDADLRSEKAIIDIITRHFPNDTIISEESGSLHHIPHRRWIIDPLDGTTNFAHRFPFYAVSIALEIDHDIILGIVFNPQMDEHFEAVKGMGAFHNNLPVTVSHIPTLNDALLATGFPYTIRDRAARIFYLFEKMLRCTQGIRRPGSASLDLCYVAAGIFDGFWEEGLKPWDTAAGSIIVREAGGQLSDFHGNPYSPYLNTIVASNARIHRAMLEVLNS